MRLLLACLLVAAAAANAQGILSTAWSADVSAAVYTVPALFNGTVVYGDMYGTFYARGAASGQKLWSKTFTNSVQSSPIVHGKTVYFGSYDYHVYAMDVASGAIIWKFKTGSYIQSTPLIRNGKLYIGSNDKNIYCLDLSTGTAIWQQNIGHTVTTNPAANDDSSVVFAAAVDNNARHRVATSNIVALNASTGAPLWAVAISDRVGNPVYHSVTKSVVFTTIHYNLTLYSLDSATGLANYKVLLGATGYLTTPLPFGQALYIGADVIYVVLASNGKLVSSFVDGGNVQGPMVLRGGVLYAGQMGGLALYNASTGATISSHAVNLGLFGPSVQGLTVYAGGAEKFYAFTRI